MNSLCLQIKKKPMGAGVGTMNASGLEVRQQEVKAMPLSGAGQGWGPGSLAPDLGKKCSFPLHESN